MSNATPDCIEIGIGHHTFRGKLHCIVCGKRRKKNVLGEPCVKCGVVLTDRNSSQVGRELRCNSCYADREAGYRKKRRRGGRSYFVVFASRLTTTK